MGDFIAQTYIEGRMSASGKILSGNKFFIGNDESNTSRDSAIRKTTGE